MQTMVIKNAVSTEVLSSALSRFIDENPEASEADAYHHVHKQVVPKSVSGSPSWYRNQLNNLIAITNRYGLPSFFLTLTADEVSEIKWEEVEEAEHIATCVDGELKWTDLPVEMALLFHRRCMEFMSSYIIGGAKNKYNVLGKRHTM